MNRFATGAPPAGASIPDSKRRAARATRQDCGAGQQEIERMAKSLFIGNLPYSLLESDLLEAFSKYGASEARIVEGRGFGFVDVEEDQAASAIEDMNETDLGGRNIFVNEARPREDRGDRR